MSKVLIIDRYGAGLSFAWRCAQAGHEVRWFVAPEANVPNTVGNGFRGIVKIANWIPHATWADIIVPLSADFFVERLEFFRKRGAIVFGPSIASAGLELLPEEGLRLLEKVGIETPFYKNFKTTLEARKYVESAGGPFVFKARENATDAPLTYVARDPADMLCWLDRLVEQKFNPKNGVMLQKRVIGTEVAIGRWLGSEGFVGAWVESLVPTEAFGHFATFGSTSKLGLETLSKLEKELTALGHRGNVALECTIDAEGRTWTTALACSPAWPVFSLMLGALETDPVQWMLDASRGKDTAIFKPGVGCCITARLNTSSEGVSSHKEFLGIPIYGVTRGNRKHLHPQAVKVDLLPTMEGDRVVTRPVWNTTGSYALDITGYGKDVTQALERARQTLKQLYIPGTVFEAKLGEKLEKQLPLLLAKGYAKHFQYGG